MGNYISVGTNRKLEEESIFIRFSIRSERGKSSLHSHDGYEIFFFQGGSATYIVGDNVYHLRPGDLLVFNAEILHKVNPSQEEPYIRSNIHFLLSYFKDIFSEEMHEILMSVFGGPTGVLIRLDAVEQDEITGLFELIDEEKKKASIGFEDMLRSYFSQLLIKIYRKYRRSLQDPVSPNITQKEYYVRRILSYININYREALTLEQIAASLHLNKYYMCHCFKSITGFTINKYISKIRMTEAKKKLRMTDEPIQQIADEVGLNNAIHFSRLFKQFEGLSPNEYRKRNRT